PGLPLVTALPAPGKEAVGRIGEKQGGTASGERALEHLGTPCIPGDDRRRQGAAPTTDATRRISPTPCPFTSVTPGARSFPTGGRVSLVPAQSWKPIRPPNVAPLLRYETSPPRSNRPRRNPAPIPTWIRATSPLKKNQGPTKPSTYTED